ncbi:MAG: response regulator [Verrucomicrobiae bacterium]|nr:response regulator [Verrucomicrobiae bacterium]
METLYDYKRFAILYVDDEEKSLRYFVRAFGDQFRIMTATSAAEGYAILQKHKDEIGLLMTDQRMPGEKGVQLLEKARQLNPRIIRVLATAYSDLDAAIQAVNSGAIYKYVTKPWEVPQLEATLRRGLEFFMVQRERDMLLREKLSVLHKLVVTDRLLGLGIIAAGLGNRLQNALTAVQNFIRLAPPPSDAPGSSLDEYRDPAFWRNLYGHVQEQVRRIGEILKLLGVGSSGQELIFNHQVDVTDVISSTLNRLSSQFQGKGIEVERSICNDLPKLLVDLPRFERLFDLLLEDELNYLPSGCRIWLRVTKVPDNDSVAPGVEIEISDNGPGLSETALRSVFDPLVIRQGTDLDYGLYLMAAYFIVYHHDGRIEVRPRQEGGTSFRIFLPATPNSKTGSVRDQEFLRRVLLNDALWERLLSTA